jgi:KEOPS complex subunit Cgi121
MTGDTTICEIRAATCSVRDHAGFLQWLKETARESGTHIICFNADMLAGKRHAEVAIRHAVRSCKLGQTISNTLEMEALLYAAGSRQCNVAASFGLHDGKNNLWVCCYPASDAVWDVLGSNLTFQAGVDWDTIDGKKRDCLMKLFGITPEELDSLGGTDRIIDLVLERVALLEVIR